MGQSRSMQLVETLDASTTARICRDGSLVAEVLCARTGIQDYLGAEVDPQNEYGLRDKSTVNVYRPASEVFSRDSMASFAAAPFTIDHPRDPVTAENWKQLGRGEVNGDVVRDGEFVRVPVIVRDADAVAKVNSTHKQLSMGYACKLVFPQDGKHPDGTVCDAYQTEIRINHIAAVRAARGGPELKISDERPFVFDGVPEAISLLNQAIALHEKHMDGTVPTTGSSGEKSQMKMMEQMKSALSELKSSKQKSGMKMDRLTSKEPTMKKIVLDGLQVDLSDADAVAAAISKLQGQVTDAQGQVATLTTESQTKDAKIATLEKAVADAKVTPAQLRDAAKAYAGVCDKAKALGVSFDDNADADAIMKAAVSSKMGDVAANWTADQIAASFAVLTADTKVDPLRETLKDGLKNVGDAAAAEQAALIKASDHNAWRTAA